MEGRGAGAVSRWPLSPAGPSGLLSPHDGLSQGLPLSCWKLSRFHPGLSPYQGTGEGAGSGGRAAPKEACPGRHSGLRLARSRSQEAAKLGAGRGPGSLCFPSPLKPGKSLMSRPRAGGLLTWGGTQAPGSRGFCLPHSGGRSSWTGFSADLRPEAGRQPGRCHRVT